jgi:hypothetical protein
MAEKYCAADKSPSLPFRGEREGPIAQRWEGEVSACRRCGLPHLTPTLSAPEGGEGTAGAAVDG